nr:PREDICTED: T-cell surface glycoprotein CD8 beta chain [Latimeria chalumnae]|eukprot:XP_006009902.2 PREDICTED: T-cell surface glycoprotein CD8 beta chain [Latimeria chalumnae]
MSHHRHILYKTQILKQVNKKFYFHSLYLMASNVRLWCKMSNIFWFFLFLDSIAYSYQKKLQQPDTFLPVEEGKDVTLKCRSQDSSTLDQGGYWFRRSRDKTQEFVLYFSSTSRIKLSSDLDSNRFSATKSTSEVTLTIKPFKKEDSGIYYCLVLQNSVLIFGTGTELVIPDSRKKRCPHHIRKRTMPEHKGKPSVPDRYA